MIKSDITYQEKMNELKLDISHPNSAGINFIFVEGNSDIQLFRKFFDLNKCKVERIPGGNAKLEKCVNVLITTYPLVIGIRDADFLHLSEFDDIKNIFLTDYHDIELTLLSQESVVNALFHEFTTVQVNQHNNLLSKLITSIEKLSYLKWLNEIEDLQLQFSRTGFQDIVSFPEFELDFIEYLKRILSNSPNAVISDYEVIMNKLSKLFDESFDQKQLTNGHDLLGVIACYFRVECKQKGVGEKELARACRMSYCLNHFKDTRLFESLSYWSAENNTELFC